MNNPRVWSNQLHEIAQFYCRRKPQQDIQYQAHYPLEFLNLNNTNVLPVRRILRIPLFLLVGTFAFVERVVCGCLQAFARPEFRISHSRKSCMHQCIHGVFVRCVGGDIKVEHTAVSRSIHELIVFEIFFDY